MDPRYRCGIRSADGAFERRERSIFVHRTNSDVPVNWEAQRAMDRDVEENADLYEVLADDADDE